MPNSSNSQMNPGWQNPIWSEVSTPLFQRMAIVAIVIGILLIPDMVAMLSVISQIFFPPAGTDFNSESIGSILFELLVVGTIFIFGTAIVIGAVRGEKQLEWVVFVIGAALEAVAFFALSIISGRCIGKVPDVCDGNKYFAGMMVVTFLTAAGLIVPMILRIDFTRFIAFYFVIASYQSDFWIYKVITESVPFNLAMVRALALLWLSLYWMWGIYHLNQRMSRLREEDTSRRRRYIYGG